MNKDLTDCSYEFEYFDICSGVCSEACKELKVKENVPSFLPHFELHFKEMHNFDVRDMFLPSANTNVCVHLCVCELNLVVGDRSVNFYYVTEITII